MEVKSYEYPPPLQGKRTERKERKTTTEEEKFEKRKDNVSQTQNNFRRLVAANLTENPLLISLTYEQNMQDITKGYKNYKSFIQAIRYRFGKGTKYIAVPEFQKRGAVHFHVLFWGLPKKTSAEEKRTRTIANIWGHGFVDVIETDGHGKLSSYLAKYMAKAFVDKRLRNQKAYVASRNVLRPVTKSIISPVPYEPEDCELVSDKTYTTQRMGQCRYRLFKFKKE